MIIANNNLDDISVLNIRSMACQKIRIVLIPAVASDVKKTKEKSRGYI